MLAHIIKASINNRFLVIMFTVLITAWGLVSLSKTPLDAIPDLSDVQVIVKTSFPGQAPQVVEDQVTYPITTTMLSVPKATAVRGYSFFGDSYVYVIFEEGTDIYWARARVQEYISQAASQLPEGVEPRLGPDATGVGWVYEYALVDRSNNHDLSQLRSLQDWFVKFELQTVPGVSEIATIGGMVKQYQITADPNNLRAYGISLSQLKTAIQKGNRETSGSVMELGEAEYMISSKGYLKNIEDIETIPVSLNKETGSPILLRDVAQVNIGPQMRRGIAELDGEGEVVGGIVVMRYGENALQVIEDTKKKLEDIRQGLPKGVEIVTTYDRSKLILNAVDNLKIKLLEEFAVVAVVCLIFLLHLRSALVAIISLPIGILMAFTVMQYQGINANIMSLGGIAIAIGAMIDAAIVMIENVHKHLEHYKEDHGVMPKGNEHWKVVTEASIEVGPALFFSLLIITLSFVPIFALEAQEGRLFSPLAFTKTYAMAAAAGLSVTLVPVLMGYFIRGKLPKESSNPLSVILIFIYRPLLKMCLAAPFLTILVSLLVILSAIVPLNKIGSEFMPELEEGDLLYMPTTLPGVSIGKAQELLMQTDKLIKTVPEVERVFGKIGRAETATDPAPLTMIETTIQFKDKSEWREGLTTKKLIEELDKLVKFPGLTNAWVQPIKTRIDMLATGIKTPVGIKVAGQDLKVIEEIGKDIEGILNDVEGTASVFSERVSGGRYIEIVPDRITAARFGLNIDDIQTIISSAVGGANITQTVEGLERYPVNLRYPRHTRDDIDKLMELPLVTPSGAHIPLSRVADIRFSEGPPMIKTENARLNGWTFVDIKDVDLGGYVKNAQKILRDKLELPPGYSVTWTGQYEYLLRVQEKLSVVIPMMLLIILLLLYITFRSMTAALIIMLSLPFALAGGIWYLYILQYNFSVAVAVGFIALAGVAAEFGVIMLIYLDNAIEKRKRQGNYHTVDDLKACIMEGAVMRVRPKAMTVAIIIAGLIPIMLGSGTGSDVMQRIAAPMIGGMITAPFLSLLVIPAIYLLWKTHELKKLALKKPEQQNPESKLAMENNS
ncbi:efflux RND transporter permease subunit [Cocleimonas sp. KMM 6892]|uniref:efflux RND transporter permease subunit n=1 Tax=unclassified Cocleimonas TaxID=2639732 RepID=UPI002DBB7A85|nr:MULTISPECIES: efflux RND transporter permease subunit [unclassified Cocleimonas]MEB8432791.1 efflux RND transporter permease subunit [Cocleimonas sp. KMM 6892]MEC4715650.1 efflux RND transporter permease subunit [Cocleimonas sp. KMM 6895]MEC4744732.1 efflux RND transporter permease subunit [Cocleimonas sp. KMM 6896]